MDSKCNQRLKGPVFPEGRRCVGVQMWHSQLKFILNCKSLEVKLLLAVIIKYAI